MDRLINRGKLKEIFQKLLTMKETDKYFYNSFRNEMNFIIRHVGRQF